MGGVLKHRVRIEWSPGFAYAIGLIASDGSLHKDGRHIFFGSKEVELMENFKKALSLEIRVRRHARGGESEKRYFCISFSDKAFHCYLQTIGLLPNKSKTIEKVDIPRKFFSDFLRGLFDGDGSFYVFQDKRWPSSFGFKISFASASPKFIGWLKSVSSKFYGVKGYLHKGKGVINLEYTKGDTRKIFYAMYYRDDLLRLNRKYFKVKDALGRDKVIGLLASQKPRTPSIAVVAQR